jgi:protein-disulfide isomerase
VKKTLITSLAFCLLLCSITAWSASTKDELEAIKATQAEMQKDLAEIKKLLKDGARAPAKAAAFKEQVISIGNSPYKGNNDAPVTIVEYSDYQCPYCARSYRDVMPKLQEEYIDTGKVRFVMREFPLASIHKNATNASLAALCAGKQDKYWEMHNEMFENQKQLKVDDLKAHAATIGLDTDAFDTCLTNKETESDLRADMASATKLGQRGTPGFFFGLTDPSDPDKVNLSVSIRGAQSIDNFRASIDDLLKSAE